MNYNFDTDMDLDWSADQLRKAKLHSTGLPDVPVRRIGIALQQGTDPPTDPAVSRDSTLGNAISGLAIHAHSEDQCRRLCESILTLISERDRVTLHAELVQLRGVDHLLAVVKRHGDECVLVALRILDKLSRTSASVICNAGGVDVALQRCDHLRETPRVFEAALRVLLGLTFDNDSKVLLLRRGVRGLAETVVEHVVGSGESQENREVWVDIQSIGTRLLGRLKEGERGYSNHMEGTGSKPLRL